IFDKYIATSGAKIKSTDEITSYQKLKEVAEDMQAKKDELGIEGAFASTSLTSGEDWRWQTHLANAPIWQEYQDKGVEDTNEIEFSYNKEYKNLFDLYLENSTVEKSLAPSKTVSDSMAEFAQGKAAMVQNGNWHGPRFPRLLATWSRKTRSSSCPCTWVCQMKKSTASTS